LSFAVAAAVGNKLGTEPMRVPVRREAKSDDRAYMREELPR